MDDQLFRLSFLALCLGTMGYRLTQHYKAQTYRDRPVTAEEGTWFGVLRLVLGLPFLVLMLSYPFYPPLLAWADLPFPAWLRWCGAGLALATVPFLVWIHRALGRNFSTTIRVRDDHTLVTWGPYRWVRHPMYTLFCVLFAAF